MKETDFNLINSRNVSEWHESVDVLVAGFGIAGACSALGAREGGARVLILEHGSGISGTTTAAAGHFYLGGGTPPQLANGFQDTAEDMYNYLIANTPEPDEEKIRLYCEQSVQHFNWLTEQGIPFNNGFYQQKHVEQPTDECLIWSGNEKAWPVSERAKPAPRGHKVEKEGSEGGSLVMKRLTEKAVSEAVNFQFDAAVKNLVIDDDGRIVGARYTLFGETRFARANQGVILATGGFAMNKVMLREYCPQLATDSIFKQGNPNDDGSGIHLGLSANGVVMHMQGALVTSPFYPPENLIRGILINKLGKRFINEDCYHAKTTDACLQQPDGVAYLICDNNSFDHPLFGMQELIDAWESIEEMESDLNLPRGALQNTVSRYNAFAAKSEDPQFHKHQDWLRPLNEPPYGALQCSLGKAGFVGFTLGGLKVSIDAEVIDRKGKAIPGLYAAGACASNIAQDGKGYSSGTCLGEASFFGRRAGLHAAGKVGFK